MHNNNQGVSTTYSQQWDLFEGREQKNENIQDKMIKDLAIFVQSISEKFHETIVCIDSNKTFIPCKSRTTIFLELMYLVYLIINKQGLENESPTHQREYQRIDFIFCTPGIE